MTQTNVGAVLLNLGLEAEWRVVRSGSQAAVGVHFPLFWGRTMSYRVIYNEPSKSRAKAEDWRRGAVWTEEFATEHQALDRAGELLEAGEHHGVAMHDHSGNEISGVRLQWRLGGFSGD
jgi:hypothetical protein